MINVDWKKVEFGISKTMRDNVPFFDTIYALAPDNAIKATITLDLHTLFITLMHKYGATEAVNMISKALDDLVEDSENSKITELNKENKDHE